MLLRHSFSIDFSYFCTGCKERHCLCAEIGFYSYLIVDRGFLCGSAGKETACSVRDLGSIPGLARSPGEGKGYPLQYSGLENSMLYSPWGRKELDSTEQLSLHFRVGKRRDLNLREERALCNVWCGKCM